MENGYTRYDFDNHSFRATASLSIRGCQSKEDTRPSASSWGISFWYQLERIEFNCYKYNNKKYRNVQVLTEGRLLKMICEISLHFCLALTEYEL